MEISRKQAAKFKSDEMGYQFSDMSGQDYILVGSIIFTIKDDLDADEKKAQEEKPKLDELI